MVTFNSHCSTKLVHSSCIFKVAGQTDPVMLANAVFVKTPFNLISNWGDSAPRANWTQSMSHSTQNRVDSWCTLVFMGPGSSMMMKVYLGLPQYTEMPQPSPKPSPELQRSLCCWGLMTGRCSMTPESAQLMSHTLLSWPSQGVGRTSLGAENECQNILTMSQGIYVAQGN